ncbi:MAG TPA: FkbM family methyltransferase [Baekduia sp.]|nr:FkbM family methyltransferase [Baekduia sp.]
MAANSPARRAAKRLLMRALPERAYATVQGWVMAADIRSGRLSEPELALVPLAVHDGDTAVDIGANYGLYTYHLSRAVGPGGRVHAFEPIPFTYAALRVAARLLRLRNVDLHAKGCADREGRCTFEVPVQHSGAIAAGLAHLRVADMATGPVPEGCSATREVAGELVALDRFAPWPAGLSFVKCDIEGAELLALTGFAATIDEHLPTVLCEVEQRHLSRFGLRREDVLRFFTERGYAAFEVRDGALCEVTAPALRDGNLVFVHPARLARLTPLLAAEGPA